MPRPVVIADDLSMHYPARSAAKRVDAVSGVTFSIAAGESLAMIGESGSGKSTLAAAIAGVAGMHDLGSPVIHGGALSVLGTDVRTMSGRMRDTLQFRVGYLPQDAGARLSPHLTAGENVAAPIYARDKRFDQHLAGQAVATLIDQVRLPLVTMNKFPYELSTGQRQRVAIARSLILEPELLVADNPTAGVDVTVRHTIVETLREVQRARGISALVIAGALDEVRALGDRILVMHEGLVAGIGTMAEILDQSWHPYVDGLVRADRLMTTDDAPAPSARV
ncbi:dipeptide/oligopeptide/nickel ABC transporter ATP-binding protein [Galbitalea sp. SE-J8]|uniref:ATP-binding cassette domain-containing protein n=1 Tax=Galbitalea sp. SE-J8 TaxID=3054952 RepID=UPI00259D0472|nr:dipeptide/oligopeptide/nickel ABC transporter ATP-binding protein [Galbitalea sp. SE-J8]MDM4761863.1 dipeptide/oligopeptide/nickel ABC transporter ATP-binding protein [Galbitalea sp. SE-J8]